jgi:hypothetical protein
MEWGTVAEWVAGLGSLAAAATALWIALDSRNAASEARRAMVRDRQAELLVELIGAVETDIRLTEEALAWDSVPPIVRSARAASLCRALWGQSNLFGTTWHLYCEEDQTWTEDLWKRGELFQRMRQELQMALDRLNSEDAKP